MWADLYILTECKKAGEVGFFFLEDSRLSNYMGVTEAYCWCISQASSVHTAANYSPRAGGLFALQFCTRGQI